MQTLAVTTSCASRAIAHGGRLPTRLLIALGWLLSLGGLAGARGENGGDTAVRRIGPTVTITEVSTGLPFAARVDTGATSCSIHYEKMEIADAAAKPRDNVGKAIRFLVKNTDGASEWIEAKIVDRVTVRTPELKDERYTVRLKLRWQDIEKKVLVTLNNRDGMNYPLLVGRNFLRGDFLVDVALRDNQ